jgi:hypothetical protein
VDVWTSLALTLGAVAALALGLRRLRGRQRRAGGGSLRAFLRHFDAAGVPDDVALEVFHQLQRWMAEADRAYPVDPRDELSVYGVEPGDVDDALAMLLAACGRRAAGTRPPLATVDELVRYLAACPPSRELPA